MHVLPNSLPPGRRPQALQQTVRPSQYSDPNHLRRRMQQRAISDEDIEVALQFGRRSHSFGSVVFTLTDRCLIETPYERERDRLRGLTVVEDSKGRIVTVKWDFAVASRAPKLKTRKSDVSS